MTATGSTDDLTQEGINMIAPHRSTRKLKTQNGRRLRRDQRRWLVERLLCLDAMEAAVLVRGEFYATNILGLYSSPITMLLNQF